jgi:hypothetical protein
MDVEKFTDNDRGLVLQELERIQKTKLTQIKPSRKLYMDGNGLPFFIFGGKEYWHGITANGLKELYKCKKEGALVIVKKFRTRLDINIGSLSIFLSNLDKLQVTKTGNMQFHCIATEDGLFIEEIPELHCNKVSEVFYPNKKNSLDGLKDISKIINIEVHGESQLTHSDIQAKLLLIGSYLNYRTYTPDKNKESIYGTLGELCSEKEIPKDSIPAMSVDTVKFVDVIWFDEEGYPTHAFEVEHSTDITKGLLRLYQIHKLRIKLYIIADETNKIKFEREIKKSPFHKIKQDYIFKNYQELDEFFESVKNFAQIQEKFLQKDVV